MQEADCRALGVSTSEGGQEVRRSWGAGASGASADPTESSEADLALQSCLVLRLEAWALHHPVTFFLCVKLQWASHPLEVGVMYAFSD